MPGASDVGEAPLPAGSAAESAARDGEPADWLAEDAAFELAREVGLRVPHRLEITEPAEARSIELDAFPGDRLVVKVRADALAHKTELGAVAVCDRIRSDLESTVLALERRVEGVLSIEGFSIHEYVEHDRRLGGELLLGARWSDEFGPVVALGLGGVEVERFAAAEPFAPILLSTAGAAAQSDILPADNTLVRFLTEPYRGREPRFRARDLAEILERTLAFAERAMMPEAAGGEIAPIEEIEFNPVVATEHGLTALDALARRSRKRPDIAPPRPLDKLENLFQPSSIAIAGVSRRRNIGRIILENVLSQGFPTDRLWVVKPGANAPEPGTGEAASRSSEIEGCRCFPSFEALPEPADLAVLSVGAAQLPDLVTEIISESRAESLILIPGGLGEREGSEEHANEIEAAIRQSRNAPGGGPVVNGGNCLGVRSLPGKFDTLFIPPHKLAFPETEASPLALLSQSGAFAVARASKLDALNPKYVVTFGNQIDLTLADYLEYFESDSDLAVFACYLEGFKPLDGMRFLEATARISAKKRAVILYRAGRTPSGARAAASHTASVSGSYRVTAELARQAGAIVADSIEEFEDLVRIFTGLAGRLPKGRSLGALSNAGFESVAVGDSLGSLGLATFSESTRSRLDAILADRGLDAIVGARNPLDVTPVLDDQAFAEAARAILEDSGTDLAVIGCVPLTGALQTLASGPGHPEDLAGPEAVATRLIELWQTSAKPWVAAIDSGRLYDPLEDFLARAGIPTFRAMDRAVRALDRWTAFHLSSR